MTDRPDDAGPGVTASLNIGVAEVVSVLVRRKNAGTLSAAMFSQALLHVGIPRARPGIVILRIFIGPAPPLEDCACRSHHDRFHRGLDADDPSATQRPLPSRCHVLLPRPAHPPGSGHHPDRSNGRVCRGEIVALETKRALQKAPALCSSQDRIAKSRNRYHYKITYVGKFNFSR